MSIDEQLLAEVEAFLKRFDIKPTTFGVLACRDPHAVRRLRQGFGLTTRRYGQMKTFMASYDCERSNNLRPKSIGAAA